MKFGMRRPSLKRRIAARTSWKRYARHSLGLKAPRGYGWLTDPKKALYNRVYNRTSFSFDRLFKVPRSTSSAKFPEASVSVSDLKGVVPSGMGPMGYLVLALIACIPTLGLLYVGFSLKMALVLPIAVVILAVWGEHIVLLGQVGFSLVALGLALYLIVGFLNIFLH